MVIDMKAALKALFGADTGIAGSLGLAGHSHGHVVGPVSHEAASLAVELGRSPGVADPFATLGAGLRNALRANGVKPPLSPYGAARLAEIDRACKGCLSWRECDGLLEVGWDEKAMAAICPNFSNFKTLH